MPYIKDLLDRIPTEEQQDNWEQNVLIPSMFKGVMDDLTRRSIKEKKLTEEIKKIDAEMAEKRKHGKFVNGEYIPNEQPIKKKENKDKTKIIEDVKEMIKNTESKKKKKHSSDINVTQEYDKLLSDLDQLQKSKKKRKIIDEVTSMLDIPKIKKSSSKKAIVIDNTMDMLSNTPCVKKSSSKKTQEIGDTLNLVDIFIIGKFNFFYIN
jgi:hypothetical protein